MCIHKATCVHTLPHTYMKKGNRIQAVWNIPLSYFWILQHSETSLPFSKIFFKETTYVDGCFPYMHVCALSCMPRARIIQKRAPNTVELWASPWVLGIEPGSSRSLVSVLSCPFSNLMVYGLCKMCSTHKNYVFTWTTCDCSHWLWRCRWKVVDSAVRKLANNQHVRRL